MRRGGQHSYRHRNITFLLILLCVVISGMFALHHLRSNNLEMQKLRSAVFEADRRGVSDTELENTIQNLRHHVLNHMNTDLYPPGSQSTEPPIQLPHKYYRDTIDYWEQRIAPIDAATPDESLQASFLSARQTCETKRYQISERLNCLVEETKDVNGMPEPPIIRVDYYSYHFVSPSWTPDVAGWSLVFCAGFVLLLFIRLIKF